MSNEVMIAFNNVTKVYKLYKSDKRRFLGLFTKRIHYKEKLAANNLSFTVNKGDAVAVFGHNGAGKSTLLKMITGVIYPTSGTIEVNGRVSALLELTAGFDTEFTGRENIYLKGQLLGISNEEMKTLEKKIIDFADLGDYIDQPVRTYSSGMKARLGFSVCVNIKPEILIVDEALSVGDAQFKSKCLSKINKLVKEEHITLLFVSHSLSTAREFCSRGMVLQRGTIIFDGPIDEAAEFYEHELTRTKRLKRAKRLKQLADLGNETAPEKLKNLLKKMEEDNQIIPPELLPKQQDTAE